MPCIEHDMHVHLYAENTKMFYPCVFSILGNQMDINELYYLTTAASGTFLKKKNRQKIV